MKPMPVVHSNLSITCGLFLAIFCINSGLRAAEFLNLPEEQAAIERAHEAVDPTRKNFINSLKKELATKAPKDCIKNCRINKPKLKGAKVIAFGRTSHKLRNPSNAPRTWVKPYLEQFSKAAPSTQPPHVLVKLSHDHYGYLEPLYVESFCLTCHGKDISGPVEETIHSLYPSDEATGFNVGDFRGFIWMEMTLKP